MMIFYGPLACGLEGVKDAPLTMTLPLLGVVVASVMIGIYPDLVTKFLSGFANILGAGGVP